MRGPSADSYDPNKDNQTEEDPLPPLDETDDVPDIPVPIALEYLEQDVNYNQVSIPLSDLDHRVTPSIPTLDTELVLDMKGNDFDTTPLSPRVVVQHSKKKSITTNV